MIVAGFGFSTRASLSSLRDAFAAAQIGQPEVTAVATLTDKVDGLAALATALNLPIVAVDGPLPETPTHSHRSIEERGIGSVAEACALAAAGAGAYLRATRIKSTDGLATCAIAQGENR